MTPELRAMLDAAIEQLPAKIELVYVDYSDSLSDDQVRMIFEGDFERLWETTNEWESDQQHHGARGYLESSTDREGFEEIFGDSAAWQEWIEECWDRDESKWFDQLASQTGGVMVRYSLDREVTPDSWQMDEDEIEAEMVGIANAAGIDYNANRSALWSLVVEASYGGELCVLHRTELADVMAVQDGGSVTFTDPQLLVYQGFNGSGSMEQIVGEVKVTLTDDTMRLDAGRYSWSDDIAGLVHSCADTPAEFHKGAVA